MINASIPMGVQPFQPPQQRQNPLAMLGQVMQLENAQSQSKMNSLAMMEKQRAMDQEEAMGKLYAGAVALDGTIDRTRLISGAAQGGLGSRIPGLSKTFAEQDKAQREADKARLEMVKQRTEMTGQAFGALRQSPTVEGVYSVLDGLQQQGVLPPEMVAQTKQQLAANPTQVGAFVEKTFMGSMQAKDQLEQVWRQKGYDLEVEKFGETKTQNRAQNQISVDNNRRSVGASLANAGATRAVAEATRDAAKIKDNRDTEMKLADDYRAQSKDFKSVVDAANRVRSALPSATKSAAATLTAATSFMKMLDPGSVVRESELGMALAATGALDRLTNYHNVLQNGKVLTANQVKDFESITNKVLEAAKQGQQAVDSNYRRQAQQYNLRPEMIVQDLGQGGGASSAIIDKADAILRGGK